MMDLMKICMRNYIPVKILTKSKLTDFTLFNWVHLNYHDRYKDLITIGNTLTGHDELEPNASPNYERISGMKSLHNAGFKTFASIEPIIHFESSLEMIQATVGFCDLYKIGLESGKKYNINQMGLFVYNCIQTVENSGAKIYFKDSITKLIPNIKNECVVTRDYKI